MIENKKIIIVGGGFGGMSCAKEFINRRGFEVTLIDRRNHHLFQPLLYQVATAGLSPADIATPIRSVFSGVPNIRVVLGNVTSVNGAEKFIELPGGRLAYDYLVLACGAKHSYFGHPEWEEVAPGLKTLEDAVEIRRKILLAFEMAENEGREKERDSLLTFVVIGAGPTGVELAGAISEIATFTLSRDFKAIDPKSTKILLVEAGPRILPSFDEKLSIRASRDLKALNVTVMTNTRVTDITPEGVQTTQGFYHSKTVLWAAGVQPSSLGKALGVETDQLGRVITQPTLNLFKYPEIYVLGDMAHVVSDKGSALPGMAPVAMQEGRHAARNIIASSLGRQLLPFKYLDKGQLATIGRKRAVMEFKKIRLGGLIAWLAWLFVHIYYLIGFKNKIFVFAQWTWAYITFKRGARII